MQKKEKEKQTKWWGLSGLAILLLFLLWMYYSDKVETQSGCVNECVSDNDFCMQSAIVFDKSYNGWISEDDYQDCFDELESCVLDCHG